MAMRRSLPLCTTVNVENTNGKCCDWAHARLVSPVVRSSSTSARKVKNRQPRLTVVASFSFENSLRIYREDLKRNCGVARAGEPGVQLPATRGTSPRTQRG